MALGGRITSPHVATSVADESVDSDAYVDGSIDLAHMSAESVDSDQYVDGSIDTAHLAADAVDGTKIADDAIDSEHYTDGSIDNAHIADDAIDSEHYAAGSIDTAHIADNQVTAAKIFDLARGSLLIGNGSAATAELTVGSDNYILTVDGSGDIGWEAAASGGISTTLADGNILVGNGSNVATSVNPSGDVDIATDGTFSIASGAVVNADVGGSAAIDYSKLAALSSGNILVGNGSNVAVSVNPSGDVDVTNAGVFSIASGVVVDADVNASAAIALSKTALTAGTNISLSTNTLNVDDAFLINDGNDTTSGIITAGGLTLSEAASVSIGTPLLPSTDHTYSGLSAEMLCGDTNNIAAFDLVCIHTTTGEIIRADASAVGTARAIGIAPAAISDTGTGTVLLQGFIRDDSWDWTIGGVIYNSETVGELTQTAPTTDGAFVQVVGIALSADVAYINPSLDIIEHA